MSSINNTVVQYFHSVASSPHEAGNSQYINQFNSLLNQITNSANGARGERKTGCCRW